MAADTVAADLAVMYLRQRARDLLERADVPARIRDLGAQVERDARGALNAIRDGDTVEATRLTGEVAARVQLIEQALDPDRRRGAKVIRGAREAARLLHGERAARIERWAAWQRWLDDLHREHPDWLWDRLQAEAAEHFAVSTRTIRERCRNPRRRI